MTVFETVRLRIREWEDFDFQRLAEVYGDQDVVRWVGDGEPITLDECQRWLEVTRRNYELRGYGMFAIDEKASGRNLGFGGIVHPGGQLEAEVKYAFSKDCWGLGYASEMLVGLLKYAANELNLKSLIATVAPDNVASVRVLAKNGFKKAQPRINDDGSQTLVFEIQLG